MNIPREVLPAPCIRPFFCVTYGFAICCLCVLVSILAFVPIVIVLLTNKDLDKKTKKILVPVAAVALILAGALSIDWNPISEEEYNATAQALQGEQVYYTPFGKSYHLDPDCRALKNSSNIYVGTIEEALEAGRHDPCDFCVEQ